MNWIDFLEDNQIHYVTRGPNTKRNECSVRCPWCGEDDPSTHLGISLNTENWGCLRNTTHRGKAPSYLIAALLGCSSTQAKLIASQYSRPDPSTLGDALAALTGTGEALKPVAGHTEAMPDLRPIKPTGSTAKFWRYLERERGFYDIQGLLDQYKIKACLTGRFKDRVIIPFFRGGEMVAWTGRAIIDPVNAPRYLSSSEVKNVVFNQDALIGGDLLFIVEGPMDALKLDFYGQHHGARATCILGIGMSMDQIGILNSIIRHYKKTVVLLDAGALESAFSVMDWLHGQNVTLGQLPDGVKDPGSMAPDEITRFVNEVLK